MELGGGGGDRGALEIDEHDRGAARDQGARGRKADAARAAGDERDLVGELIAHHDANSDRSLRPGPAAAPGPSGLEAGAQLAQAEAHAPLDGARREREPARDLLVREPVEEAEADYLALAPAAARRSARRSPVLRCARRIRRARHRSRAVARSARAGGRPLPRASAGGRDRSRGGGRSSSPTSSTEPRAGEYVAREDQIATNPSCTASWAHSRSWQIDSAVRYASGARPPVQLGEGCAIPVLDRIHQCGVARLRCGSPQTVPHEKSRCAENSSDPNSAANTIYCGRRLPPTPALAHWARGKRRSPLGVASRPTVPSARRRYSCSTS